MAVAPGDPVILARMPGYRVATTVQSADSSNFTGTEVSLMSVTGSLINGVKYLIWAEFSLASSVANDAVGIRLREDSLTGTERQSKFITIYSATRQVPGRASFEYTASATGSKTFVLTGQRDSGTGNCRIEAAGVNREAYLAIEVVE